MATPKSFKQVGRPPAFDDDARPPCLQTGTPAPATTMAAMVDTLMVPLRSPPVPHVSMSRSLRSDGTGDGLRPPPSWPGQNRSSPPPSRPCIAARR